MISKHLLLLVILAPRDETNKISQRNQGERIERTKQKLENLPAQFIKVLAGSGNGRKKQRQKKRDFDRYLQTGVMQQAQFTYAIVQLQLF